MREAYFILMLTVTLCGTIGVTLLAILRGLVRRIRDARISIRYLFGVTLFVAIGLALCRITPPVVLAVVLMLVVYPLVPILFIAASEPRSAPRPGVNRDPLRNA